MADSPEELTVMLRDFKAGLDVYLAARGDPHVRSLADLIDFNRAHAEEELRFFGQDRFLAAQAVDLADPAAAAEYEAALAANRRRAREDGIDAVMGRLRLDALVAPTNPLAWKIDLVDGDHLLGGSATPTSLAGYPAVTVPAGLAYGLPVGLTFMGGAFSEPTLIRLASGFEAATSARRPPQFLRAVP
jgi:amidase